MEKAALEMITSFYPKINPTLPGSSHKNHNMYFTETFGEHTLYIHNSLSAHSLLNEDTSWLWFANNISNKKPLIKNTV